MARKGRQAVRNGGFPAWALVVIGIIVGAIAMWLVLHFGHMPISRPDNGPQPAAAGSAGNAGPGIAARTQPKQPKYDFYSLLPEKEVRIPDAQLDAEVKAEQQAGTATGAAESHPATGAPASTAATGKGQYMLQVQSFLDGDKAEALKARLALKGFRAEIQAATIDGKTWNRVRIGPFPSASALEGVKQRLQAAGFPSNALLVKDD